MLKTEVIHARVTPDLKHSVEAVLHKVGMSTTDAITLFFHQIALHKGLPFAVRIPNAETRKAVADTKAGRNMTSHASVASLRKTIERKPTKPCKMR